MKGKDTARFLLDAMKTESFGEHLGGHCEDRECPALIQYRIISDKCVLCGICKDACKYNAIQGEKKVSYRTGYLPFEVRQKRCVKCGDCYSACQYGAIEIIEEKTAVLV
jgi:ferredoxin